MADQPQYPNYAPPYYPPQPQQQNVPPATKEEEVNEPVPAGSSTPGAVPPSVIGTSQDPNRKPAPHPASYDQTGKSKDEPEKGK